VIGLVQVGEASMADRYAYIPLIGIFVMIAWGLDDFAKARERESSGELSRRCVCCSAGLRHTSADELLGRDYDLGTHAGGLGNAFAHDALGSALLDPDMTVTPNSEETPDTESKRLEKARQHFERALELRRQGAQQNPSAYLPDMATTLNNLGNLDRLENGRAKPVSITKRPWRFTVNWRSRTWNLFRPIWQ